MEVVKIFVILKLKNMIFLKKNKLKIKNIFKLKLKAFTLVEMMVATSLFSIIVMGSILVLISAQKTYKKISQNRIVIDNLNLLISNINQELKYGTHYACATSLESNLINSFINFNFSDYTNLNCNNILFSPQNEKDKIIVYFFEKETNSIFQKNFLCSVLDFEKQNFICSETGNFKLNSENFLITNFKVKLKNDSEKVNSVEVLISGKLNYENLNEAENIEKVFSIETFLYQRNISK